MKLIYQYFKLLSNTITGYLAALFKKEKCVLDIINVRVPTVLFESLKYFQV